MKIAVFEVREDEQKYFRELEKKTEAEIQYSHESLRIRNIHQAEGCIGISILGQSRIDCEIIDALKERGVKYISTRTVGYNHIDIRHAHKSGIQVSNSDYAPNGVADYTVMLMLMCLRNYKQALFRGNVNDYSLAGLQGKEMRDMTIGIIGTGRIGQAVIQNLQGFGSRILAYSAHEKTELKELVTYVTKEELLKESDIVTLHTPLFPSTYHIINEDAINMMKSGVILINTARGELIDAEAVIAGIENKRIGALGLDVIEYEEGIYHRDRRSDIINNRAMAYLRQFPNVTMTQHIAFYTEEAVASMAACGINNILEFADTGSCRLEIKPDKPQ